MGCCVCSMVRETRHLWVGNLPDNVSKDRIKEYFNRSSFRIYIFIIFVFLFFLKAFLCMIKFNLISLFTGMCEPASLPPRLMGIYEWNPMQENVYFVMLRY